MKAKIGFKAVVSGLGCVRVFGLRPKHTFKGNQSAWNLNVDPVLPIGDRMEHHNPEPRNPEPQAEPVKALI